MIDYFECDTKSSQKKVSLFWFNLDFIGQQIANNDTSNDPIYWTREMRLQ